MVWTDRAGLGSPRMLDQYTWVELMQVMKFLRLFVGDVKIKGCVEGLMKKYSMHKRASGVCVFTT